MFHRVEDMWVIPAGRWARLVERLWFYPGVMQARMVEQTAARGGARGGAAPARDPGVEVVEATPQTLATHPAFAGMFDQ